MRFTIEIRMRNTEGALERVLGRLRQRGFALCALAANISNDESAIDARITLAGNRATEPLIRQLDKLYDVMMVKLNGEASNVKRQFSSGNTVEACVPV